MKNPTRRAVCGITVSSVVALASTGSSPAEENSKDGEESLILIGPFRLSDLYNTQFGPGFKSNIPATKKEVIAAFKETQICILEKRIKKNDRWYFAEAVGYPKILVEGKCSFAFEHSDNKSSLINIVETSLKGTDTYGKPIEYRKTHMGVTFDIETTSGLGRTRLGGINCGCHQLKYYPDGKFSLIEPAKK